MRRFTRVCTCQSSITNEPIRSRRAFCISIKMSSKKEDYFNLLGVSRCVLPQENDKWIESLKRSYRKAQMVHHPDKSIKDGSHSGELSVRLNAAYETLKSPYERLRHLLTVHNISVSECDLKKIRLRQEFLMEMLELNERLQNVLSIDAPDKKLEGIETLRRCIKSKVDEKMEFAQREYEAHDMTLLAQTYTELSYLCSAYDRAISG